MRDVASRSRPLTALVVVSAAAIAAGAVLQVPDALHLRSGDPSLPADVVLVAAWLALPLVGVVLGLAMASVSLSLALWAAVHGGH